jgi:glycosyltransferase involved in cell wall biosynthesis
MVFVWEQFGPYHIDRCGAVARHTAGTWKVVGIEIAETSASHLWDHPDPPADFPLITLFKGVAASHSRMKIFLRLMRELARLRPALCFLCHYDRIEIFLASLVLRLLRVRVFAMQESKFDDKPRRLFRELLKSVFLLPYAGVIVGGARARSYMEFLGFRPDRVAEGYDTVSVERITSLAGVAPAPEGLPYRDRHFTIIARLVEKKNLFMAVDAYAKYCEVAGSQRRDLHICGDGALRGALQAHIERRAIDGILLRGIVQPALIPTELAATVALILPSTEEQWGLVANEAVAMGLPLLLSTNCGAADSLLRAGVNGFLFEPDNRDGLAYFMELIGRDEALWRRMCHASTTLAPLADARRFHEGVAVLLDHVAGKGARPG